MSERNASARTVTAAQMKQIEKNAYNTGMPYLQMMENAGAAAYRIIRERYPDAHELVVFAGKGNNGGDGFVIARLAARDGLSVLTVLVEGEPVTEDAGTNLARLAEESNICQYTRIIHIRDVDSASAIPAERCVIVDALYGTGFHGELREAGRRACAVMNESPAPVAALDLPSGTNADTGEAAQGAVRADITIAFDSYKYAHHTESSAPLCGELLLADIGIPEDCHDV